MYLFSLRVSFSRIYVPSFGCIWWSWSSWWEYEKADNGWVWEFEFELTGAASSSTASTISRIWIKRGWGRQHNLKTDQQVPSSSLLLLRLQLRGLISFLVLTILVKVLYHWRGKSKFSRVFIIFCYRLGRASLDQNNYEGRYQYLLVSIGDSNIYVRLQ